MDLDGFRSRVDVREPHECWPWKGGVSKDRGRVRGLVYFRGAMRLATRVAFYAAHGYWPAAVLHSCDNPMCCNPAHLIGGTQQDNIRDRDAKGRQCKGRAHPLHGHNVNVERGRWA